MGGQLSLTYRDKCVLHAPPRSHCVTARLRTTGPLRKKGGLREIAPRDDDEREAIPHDGPYRKLTDFLCGENPLVRGMPITSAQR